MIRFLIFILLSSSIILHADKVNINNINVNLPKVKGYYLFSASNHPEIIEAFNMVYASFGQFYGLYVKEESSWKLLSGNTPNHYVTVGIPNGFDEIIFSKEGTEVFFKDMKKRLSDTTNNQLQQEINSQLKKEYPHKELGNYLSKKFKKINTISLDPHHSDKYTLSNTIYQNIEGDIHCRTQTMVNINRRMLYITAVTLNDFDLEENRNTSKYFAEKYLKANKKAF